jgi:hypothetical protein
MSLLLSQAADPALLMEDAGYPPDPWQAHALRCKARRILLLCGRQQGKSLTTAIKSLHHAMFRSESLVLLVSRSQDQADGLFLKITRAYDKLSRPVPEKRRLASELWLENDSRIVALSCKAETIRGWSDCTLLVLDEASRIPQDIIVATLPMLMASHGDVMMLSTPAGQSNFFYECWSDPQGGWERIVARASDCPRFDPIELAQLHRSLGPAMASQELDCCFLRDDQQVFSTESIDAIFDTDEQALHWD